MKLINSEIRFEVTNKCNASCIMCPREKMKRSQGVMDMELYKRVLDEAVLAGAKQVSLENYGETFLDPLIFERAKYAKSKGLEVLTITNGSLLDEEKCNNILKYFDTIRISMYGITRDTFEKIHRGLKFKEVKENTERLLRMREESKQKKPKIEMYFLLMKENEHEMDEFIKQYKNKVDALSVWRPHNWGDGRDYRKHTAKKVTCGRPLTGPIQVQWDGLVVPCCFDYDSKIVLGDLNKQTLHEVVKGDRFNALRCAHTEGDFKEFPFCDVCDQLRKRDDVLVYTTIKNSKVGATNTTYFDLEKD